MCSRLTIDGPFQFAMNRWTRRWFKLEGAYLAYFDSQSSSVPSVRIPLQEVTSIHILQPVKKGVFTFVVAASVKDLTLRAATKEDAERWMRLLRQQVALWKKGGSRVSVDAKVSLSVPEVGAGQGTAARTVGRPVVSRIADAEEMAEVAAACELGSPADRLPDAESHNASITTDADTSSTGTDFCDWDKLDTETVDVDTTALRGSDAVTKARAPRPLAEAFSIGERLEACVRTSPSTDAKTTECEAVAHSCDDSIASSWQSHDEEEDDSGLLDGSYIIRHERMEPPVADDPLSGMLRQVVEGSIADFLKANSDMEMNGRRFSTRPPTYVPTRPAPRSRTSDSSMSPRARRVSVTHGSRR